MPCEFFCILLTILLTCGYYSNSMADTENKGFIYSRASSFHLRFLGFFIVLIMFALIPLVVLISTRQTREKSQAASSATILVTSPVKSVPVGRKIPVAILLVPGTNLVSVVKLVL